jgi:F-type H+-transporting ATPase subunit b
VAVAAAAQVLSKQMTAEGAAASIDAAIAQVDAKLH